MFSSVYAWSYNKLKRSDSIKYRISGVRPYERNVRSLVLCQKEIESKGMEILYLFIRTYFYDT